MAVVGDQEHFLEADAEVVDLAVLGFQREDHAGGDVFGVVQGPDPGDHRPVVLGQAEAVAPQVGGGLVFLVIPPGF